MQYTEDFPYRHPHFLFKRPPLAGFSGTRSGFCSPNRACAGTNRSAKCRLDQQLQVCDSQFIIGGLPEVVNKNRRRWRPQHLSAYATAASMTSNRCFSASIRARQGNNPAPTQEGLTRPTVSPGCNLGGLITPSPSESSSQVRSDQQKLTVIQILLSNA